MSDFLELDVELSLGRTLNQTLTNTYDVAITAVIFSPVCFLLVLLFVVLRRFSVTVFSPRTIVLDEDARPTRLPRSFFTWVPLLFKSDFDDSVLTNVGMDAYVYLRIIRLGAILCLFAAPVHLLVLGPLYSSQGAVEDVEDTDYLQSISLSNVQGDSPGALDSYWVACAFVYTFTAFGMLLLRHEYRHFTAIRQSRHGAPRSYTALVERLPEHLRSEEKLKVYFDNVFPGAVARIDIVPVGATVKDLAWLVARRDALVMKLERAKLDSVEGKVEATHLQFDLVDADQRQEEEGKERTLCGIPLASRACCYGRLPHLFQCGTWVKSVEYYTNALAAVEERLVNVRERAIRRARNGNVDVASDISSDKEEQWETERLSTISEDPNSIFSKPLAELNREEALKLLGDESTVPHALEFSAAFVTFNALLPRTIVSEPRLV
jgi:hypothetical protein